MALRNINLALAAGSQFPFPIQQQLASLRDTGTQLRRPTADTEAGPINSLQQRPCGKPGEEREACCTGFVRLGESGGQRRGVLLWSRGAPTAPRARLRPAVIMLEDAGRWPGQPHSRQPRLQRRVRLHAAEGIGFPR